MNNIEFYKILKEEIDRHLVERLKKNPRCPVELDELTELFKIRTIITTKIQKYKEC